MFKAKRGLDVNLRLEGQTFEQQPKIEGGTDLESKLNELEINTEYTLDLKSDTLENLGEVGAGSGGTVIRARHKLSGLLIARKIIHVVASDEQRKLILRELQLLHDCHSPQIVSFYGAFFDEGDISVCMEFMDLGSFDRIYKVEGSLSEELVGKVAVAVLDGLDYLYRTHKIMHRDIKPSNILLNSKGEIKICDFGVSGQLINSIAKTFVGTSWYMAPERIQARDYYGVQSDTWSLGLTLMELAIGRFPFPPADSPKQLSIFELLSYIINEPPPKLPADDSRFSKDFVDFIESCLIKEDTKRPTPSALMDFAFVKDARKVELDMVAWAQKIKAKLDASKA